MVGGKWIITIMNNMKGFLYIILFATCLVIGNMLLEMYERCGTEIDWQLSSFLDFIDGIINQ
jgi:hypothetical protein